MLCTQHFFTNTLLFLLGILRWGYPRYGGSCEAVRHQLVAEVLRASSSCCTPRWVAVCPEQQQFVETSAPQVEPAWPKNASLRNEMICSGERRREKKTADTTSTFSIPFWNALKCNPIQGTVWRVHFDSICNLMKACHTSLSHISPTLNFLLACMQLFS